MVEDVVAVRGWDKYLSDRDREVIAKSGYGARQGFGSRPALVIVDVTYSFCGTRPDDTIMDSLDDWHNSCGEEAWAAVDQIATLLPVFREKGLPVVYTTRQEPGGGAFFEGRWKDKNPRFVTSKRPEYRNLVVESLAPGPRDIVVEKMKPSGFHGTPLVNYLIDLNVDSIIVAGVATSGCVRATVVDAASLNFKVSVLEEGTFDRCEASHWMSLFDMDSKYADVVSVADVREFAGGLPTGLFGDQLTQLEGGQMVHAKRVPGANELA